MFAELYSKPARPEQFMDATSGISAGNFQALAERFDFSRRLTDCRRRRKLARTESVCPRVAEE
jgi:hypothetical protein